MATQLALMDLLLLQESVFCRATTKLGYIVKKKKDRKKRDFFFLDLDRFLSIIINGGYRLGHRLVNSSCIYLLFPDMSKREEPAAATAAAGQPDRSNSLNVCPCRCRLLYIFPEYNHTLSFSFYLLYYSMLCICMDAPRPRSECRSPKAFHRRMPPPMPFPMNCDWVL